MEGKTWITELNALGVTVIALLQGLGYVIPATVATSILGISNILVRIATKKGWLK